MTVEPDDGRYSVVPQSLPGEHDACGAEPSAAARGEGAQHCNGVMMQVDDEAKAELLCFLVVGHLIAIARTGQQLQTNHLIESSVLWLQSHGAECDWLDRAKVMEISREVARQAFARSYPKDELGLLKLFNLQAGWFLDYRSPIVQEIHGLSVARLIRL